MTNHKWNMLNIMRFYNRIGKPFNSQVYLNFVTPHEGAQSKTRNPISLPQANDFVRRYVENKWCKRVGENLVLTQKGLDALIEWEKKKAVEYVDKREKDYIAKGHARPNVHGPDGKYLSGGRNPRKQKKAAHK